MEINECVRAAELRFPVVHGGIVYKRISRISRVYTSDLMLSRGFTRSYYRVELEDKNTRSVTEADPADVELYKGDWKK